MKPLKRKAWRLAAEVRRKAQVKSNWPDRQLATATTFRPFLGAGK